MNDLSFMRRQLLKRVLPFMLALLLGLGASWLAHRGLRRGDFEGRPVSFEGRLRVHDAAQPAIESAPRELPELRVLSPMLMEEVRVFQSDGGDYETPRILSPEGDHYSVPERKPYRRAVLQLNFLFGADGSISEITPLVKRHDCSICTQGPSVVGIDPREPRWAEQVEAAKEAVRRIQFVPGTHNGRPAGMHGLAECVFRLE